MTNQKNTTNPTNPTNPTKLTDPMKLTEKLIASESELMEFHPINFDVLTRKEREEIPFNMGLKPKNSSEYITKKGVKILKPTILYIKTHNTGLKYFGKSSMSINRFKYYSGSGVLWSEHLYNHGSGPDFIKTEILGIFDDIDILVETATLFSLQNDIVTSELWANRSLENGLSGGNFKMVHTDEHRRKNSETKMGALNPNYGRVFPKSTRLKMREAKLGTKQKRVTCPHCNKEGGVSGMATWHFDKCKYKEVKNEI